MTVVGRSLTGSDPFMVAPRSHDHAKCDKRGDV
jgi:hypothetical protein